MMKKLLLFLGIIMCPIISWGYVFSAVASSGHTLYYTWNNDGSNTLSVTYPSAYSERYWSGSSYVTIYYYYYNTPKPTGDLIIPDFVVYQGTTYFVTRIGRNAFADCVGLTSVTLGNNIVTIEDDAFSGCSSMERVVIGDSLTTIGDRAFLDCVALDSISISSPVERIGNAAFFRCNSLSWIHLSESVNSIGSNAFYECIALSEIIFSGSVADWCNIDFGSLYSNPIYYAHSLIINDSVLTKVSFPDTLFHIKKYVFAGCSSLTECIFSDRTRIIDEYAFSGCSGLVRIIITDSVSYINSGAFRGCSGLKMVYIGVSVNGINEDAFAGCDLVDTLVYNSRNCSRDAFVVGYGSGLQARNVFGQMSNVSTLYIGDSVQILPDYAFNGCSSLRKVSIGYDLREIGTNTFSGCVNVDTLIYNVGELLYYFNSDSFVPFHNIHSLTIGDSVVTIPAGIFHNFTNLEGMVSFPPHVTTIGGFAFGECTGISCIEIPNTVTNIGASAFRGCAGVQKVILGESIRNIGENAFGGCVNVDTLIYNVANCGESSFTTRDYYNDLHSNYQFQRMSNLTTLIFGESVRVIPGYAFWGCGNISNEIIFPSSLDIIGEFAFAGCESITGTLHLNSVKYVGSHAFEGCSDITGTIDLTDSLEALGNGAFINCDNILYLNTNNSTAAIGDSAFYGCDRLVTVNIGNSTQGIGNGVFDGCFRLSEVAIGGSVSYIGNNAFKGCVRLVMPNLPVGLTSIGNNAFNGCSYVEGELEFPSTLTDIGTNAFAGCGDITQLTMKGSNPPTIYGSTFQGLPTTTPVRVPCGSVLNYYVSDNWENFSDIAESSPFKIAVSANYETMGDVVVSQAPTCSNNNAIITAVANPGYHFLHWNDGVNANPRQFAATKDTAFEAVFVVNNSYITVHSSDSAMGGVSGSGLYGYNAPVVLQAMANSNYHFLKWTDGNTTNPRYLMATQDSSFTAVFVSNISNIQVGSMNPEMGTASGGGLCYYQNQISLSASPLYGYHFVSWNDGNTQNPRTVIVSQDSTFMAVFAVSNFSINVSGNNSSYGSVSGTGSYAYNTEMSMTATPAYGYHFEQWNDGNANNPRTITVTRDSMFVAQFAANVYQISVEANDPVMGSAFGGGNFNYNTQLTLTATPTYGYHFTQWSDGVTDNPRIVTVSTNANYSAQFEINSYSLSVNSSNPAIGTAAGGGSYNYLSPVNITAYPNIGYHFTQWSDGNTDNPRLVSVTQNATYTAQFAINTYAISATSSNSIRGMASGSGTYAHFAQDTLRATAFYGYHFTQWNDGNTDNPRIVVVTDVANYEAQFDPNNYQVIGNSTDLTIGVVSGSGSYPYQSQTALTAIAMDHYHFVQWTDSITDNPRTITVTRDTVLTAQFAIDQHQVMMLSSNTTMGTISSTLNVNYGGATYISATPNYGYHFTQWSDGSTQNPRRVVVTQDTIFTAQFDYNNYSAQLNVNDTVMGSVAGTGTYQYLTNVTIEAIANYGYHFSRWSDENNDNPRQIQLTQDTILTAQFSVNQYSVVLYSSDSLHGSVVGGGDYDYLSQVTLTATPVAHYHFVQWSDGNTSNPRVLTVVADVEYSATFEEDEKFEVVVMANDSTRGSTTAGGMYYAGDQITIRATANDHYYFSEWSDGNSANPRVVTVVGNATYMANFMPNPYVVTLAVNDNSMGNVAGGGTYDYGSEVSISATAYPGHHFARWHDGDTANPRTIRVEDNCYYQAIFEADNTEGISEMEYDYSVRTANMQIMVDGVMGRKVEVYDISGRRIAYIDKSGDKMIANVPARGVYLVKVGDTPARKVVVM